MEEYEYPVLDMTAPETQVPLPSPHATDRGMHCRATVRTVTAVHTVRTTMDARSILRTPCLASASRYNTSPTLNFERYKVIMYTSCTIKKYLVARKLSSTHKPTNYTSD